MRNQKNPIWTQGVFDISDNKIWLVPYNINVLCSYDLESGLLSDIVPLWGTNRTSAGIFLVICEDDYVMGIPGFDSNIYIYNKLINDGQFEKTIKIRGEVVKGYESYFLCARYEKSVFIFPIRNQYLIKVLNNDKKPEFQFIECDSQMVVSLCAIDERVYYVDRTNSIKSFDMENELFEEVLVNQERKDYRNIVKVNNEELLVVDIEGKVDLLCINDKLIRNVVCLDEQIYSLTCVGEYVYFFPQKDDTKIIRLSTSEWKTEVIKLGRGEHYIKWTGPAFSEPFVLNEEIYVMNTHQQCLYIIHTESGDIDQKYIMWDDTRKDVEIQLSKIVAKNTLMKEGDPFYLDMNNYIKAILDD